MNPGDVYDCPNCGTTMAGPGPLETKVERLRAIYDAAVQLDGITLELPGSKQPSGLVVVRQEVFDALRVATAEAMPPQPEGS